MASACPSLLALCVDMYVAEVIASADAVSLAELPEDVVWRMLANVLRRGALDFRLARIFITSGHRPIRQWFDANVDLERGVSTSNPREGCRP